MKEATAIVVVYSVNRGGLNFVDDRFEACFLPRRMTFDIEYGENRGGRRIQVQIWLDAPWLFCQCRAGSHLSYSYFNSNLTSPDYLFLSFYFLTVVSYLSKKKG